MPHTNMKACPKCGAFDSHIAEWFADSGEVNYYGVCDACGFEDDAHCQTEWDAIDHWNHRAHAANDENPYGDDPYNIEE